MSNTLRKGSKPSRTSKEKDATHLPICLRPFELESLDSLLARLRVVNCYPEPAWYRYYIDNSHVSPNLLTNRAHLRQIAVLTGLELHQLRGMTLHRFAPYFQTGQELKRGMADNQGNSGRDSGQDDYPVWGAHKYSLFVRDVQTPPICSLCVAEHKATLLPWTLRCVTVCPKHKLLLVSRCPSCGRALKLGARRRACRYCFEPVRRFSATSIDGHEPSLALAELVQYGIGISPKVDPLWSARLGPLAYMPPGMVMRFLWKFAVVLSGRVADDPLFNSESLPPGVVWERPPLDPWEVDVPNTHGVLAYVCGMVLDWPHNWYRVLELVARSESRQVGLHQYLPGILARTFLEPEWAWLRESWADFVGAKMYSMPEACALAFLLPPITPQRRGQS